MENNYVVYLHERKDKPGHIFYCGSGVRNRAFQRAKNHRNDYWHKIVNKHDYIVHIIAEGLTKEESLCLEGFITREWKDLDMCEACFEIPINGEHSKASEETINKLKKWSELNGGTTKGKIAVHLNNEIKFIDPNLLNNYINLGYKLGVSDSVKSRLKTASLKIKDKISGKNHHSFGKFWVTNGILDKMISEEEYLLSYYSLWRPGRCNVSSEGGKFVRKPETLVKMKLNQLGRKRINNGVINKCVKLEELENYISQGWGLGFIKK